MATDCPVDEREVHEAVTMIVDRLIHLDDDARNRVFSAAQTILGVAITIQTHRPLVSSGMRSTNEARNLNFSDREEVPPKEFLFQKHPKTDVERVACLAYYLAHFRDTPHFKTVDISKLNTEAAHVKLSNTAYTVANAANAGLLVSAGKGAKQISAMGERFVEALPDHNAAKEVKSSMKPRRGRKKANGKSK